MLKENNDAREEVNIHKWHTSGYTGKNIHVVIFDTKATPHDHMKNYAVSPFITKTTVSHGTNVAQCIHEFAPDAKVTMLYSSDECREWFKKNANTVDLVNISMSAIEELAEYSWGLLKDYDIPVCCSSGNNGKDRVNYPSAFDWTLSIGAYNWLNKGVNANDVTSYSNGGEKLDCVAPTNIYVKNNEGMIFTFDGTSAASPAATGILACYAQYLKQSGSRLTRELAKKFIHNNCTDIREKGFDIKSGHGLFFMPEVPSIITAPTIPSKPIAVKPIIVPPSPVQQAGDKDKLTEKEIIEIMEQYFKDVGKSSALFNDIQKAVDRGITSGYSDGTFRPNDTVTRGQMMAFINRAIDYTLKEVKK